MAAKAMRSSPFTIYSDSDSSMPQDRGSSPSPYDADGSMLSDESEVILPSIETPETESRKHSIAYTAVSSIPPSIRSSDISPFTPHKGPRAAFRSPNSIRALQMASPPPFSSPKSGSNSRRYRLDSPASTRNGSPRRGEELRRHTKDYTPSTRSMTGSERGTPTLENHESGKARGPLVLLHVTLLPCPTLAYSVQTISELAPAYFLENWRLLQEKLSDTVLTRGILIPHPGEEYDLLEERLLESLDLCPPRITDCGHFYTADDESDADSGTDSGVSDVGRDSGVLPLLTDVAHQSQKEDVCHDCCKLIQRPGKGIGSGTRRWTVKIYAANGLMRAGAWAAAWREMERVDVEIEPWLSEQVKRELDSRREQEEHEEQTRADEAERLRLEIGEVERARIEAEAAKTKADEKALEMESEVNRLNDALLAMSQTTVTASTSPEKSIKEEKPEQEPVAKQPAGRTSMKGAARIGEDIPLSKVLLNYVYLLAQDRRNVALAILSVLVVILAMGSGSGKETAPATPLKSMTSLAENAQFATPILSSSITASPQTDTQSMASLASTPPVSLNTAHSVELPLKVTSSNSAYASVVADPPIIASAPAAVDVA